MGEYIHFEGTSMKYLRSPIFLTFVVGKGYTPTDQLQVGDVIKVTTDNLTRRLTVVPPPSPEDP